KARRARKAVGRTEEGRAPRRSRVKGVSPAFSSFVQKVKRASAAADARVFVGKQSDLLSLICRTRLQGTGASHRTAVELLRPEDPHNEIHQQLHSKRPAAIQQNIPWRSGAIR